MSKRPAITKKYLSKRLNSRTRTRREVALILYSIVPAMGIQQQIIRHEGREYTHHYLCHYRPRHQGVDNLSRSLIRFKMGLPLEVRAWSECAVSSLHECDFGPSVLVLRALSSDEQYVDGQGRTSLDHLGQSVASAINGVYRPELLLKTRPSANLKPMTRIQRELELNNIYQFNVKQLFDEVLILDDILTTGTTMKVIINSIHRKLPYVQIRLFTLASTDYVAELNQLVELTGESYSWKEEHWAMVGEGEVSYGALAALKWQILGDRF